MEWLFTRALERACYTKLMYQAHDVEEPTAALKRRIYLSVHLFALTGSVAAFFLNELFANATPFSRVVLASVSLSHLVMTGALLWRWFPLRVVEVGMVVVAVGMLERSS